MTASIDRYTFLAWDGRIPPCVCEHRDVTRPGVDGTGVIWDAWRRPKATIRTTTVCQNTSDRDATEIAYRALIKQSVAVVSPIGETFADVLVLDVQVIKDQTLITDQWTLTTTWTLLATSAAPTATTP